MLNFSFLNDIADKVCHALPPAVKQCGNDVEQHVKATVISACEKLNLVTREAFDLQVERLAKSQAQLHALEQRLAELEAQLKESTQR